MPDALRIPYTQQFAPASTPLMKLLAILRQHEGKTSALTTAISSAFFKGSKTPDEMARNTLISLRFHGVLADADLTNFGKQLVAINDEQAAHEALARNILLNLHGVTLVETLREMQTAGIKCTLGSITDELKKRGFDASDNSSDLSGVLNWLRQAGVLKDYAINDEKLGTLIGATPKTLEALKNLSAAQIAFLRALVALGVTDWTPHNKIVQHAEQLYSGQVTYNWKDIDRSILQPLVKEQLIEVRKAPKSTGDSRGGKAADVRPTDKCQKEIAEPILKPLYQAAGTKDIRKIRSYPLPQLVADIRQKRDDQLRGEALEILAIRICQILDLDFGGWRETDEDVMGQVDAFMYSSRLVHTRWQIRCKAGPVTVDDIATEIGLTHWFGTNVVVIASIESIDPRAEAFAEIVRTRRPIHVVLLSGKALEMANENANEIMKSIRHQATTALCAA
jgi:hypothetical protein